MTAYELKPYLKMQILKRHTVKKCKASLLFMQNVMGKLDCINLRKLWVMSRGLAQMQGAMCAEINLLSISKIQMKERNRTLHTETHNCTMHSWIWELNLVHIQIKFSFHTLLLCFVHEKPSCLPSCLSVVLDHSFISGILYSCNFLWN